MTRQLSRMASPGTRPVAAFSSGNRSRALSRVFERVVRENPDLVQSALITGLKSRPPHSAVYLRLLADFLEEKPTQRHAVTGAIAHVHTTAEELAQTLSPADLEALERILLTQQGAPAHLLPSAPDIQQPQAQPETVATPGQAIDLSDL